MPDPRKKLIMDRFGTNLAPLVSGTLRSVTRERDRTAAGSALPLAQYYDGEESTVSKDATKWTCRFPVFIYLVFENASEKDALVNAVQKKVEGDMTINGLGSIIDGGNEDALAGPRKQKVHETVLRYLVEYTRKIGDPESAS